MPLDCHLMVKDARFYALECCKAGANIVTVHYEVFNNNKSLLKLIKQIKKHKVLCGVSIKPSTDVNCIKDILPYLDVVLVMSVEPGKSGQKYILNSNEKISYLKQLREENKLNFLIEVDGGINADTCVNAVESGADILVSGSYIYSSDNFNKAIQTLRVNK